MDRGIVPGIEKLGVPVSETGKPISDYLVPYLIDTLAESAPWLLGLLAVCALAAMQSTGAAYMSTASGIITRDLYRHFFAKEASHQAQVFVGRLAVAVIIGLALLVGLASGDLLVLLGGAAVSYRFPDVAGSAGDLLHPFLHASWCRLRSRRRGYSPLPLPM